MVMTMVTVMTMVMLTLETMIKKKMMTMKLMKNIWSLVDGEGGHDDEKKEPMIIMMFVELTEKPHRLHCPVSWIRGFWSVCSLPTFALCTQYVPCFFGCRWCKVSKGNAVKEALFWDGPRPSVRSCRTAWPAPHEEKSRDDSATEEGVCRKDAMHCQSKSAPNPMGNEAKPCGDVVHTLSHEFARLQ